jgi:hypothetical protein
VEARFSAPVQTGPEARLASYTMGTGSLPGVKRPGRGVDHPPPSSGEIKERVEPYIYSPFWAFVAYSRVKFTVSYKNVCITVKASLSRRHNQHFHYTKCCTKLHRGSSTKATRGCGKVSQVSSAS